MPDALARWLIDNAHFGVWWPPVAENLQRVGRGEVRAAEVGLDFRQGGGNGWWTPVGILNAGNWTGAEAEIRNLSRIWKCGREQDLLSATQTGLANAMRGGAAFDDVLEGILKPCGALARRLIGRGMAIGLRATSTEDLAERVYAEMLFPSSSDDLAPPPDAPDAPLPEPTPRRGDTDDRYLGLYGLAARVA